MTFKTNWGAKRLAKERARNIAEGFESFEGAGTLKFYGECFEAIQNVKGTKPLDPWGNPVNRFESYDNSTPASFSANSDGTYTINTPFGSYTDQLAAVLYWTALGNGSMNAWIGTLDKAGYGGDIQTAEDNFPNRNTSITDMVNFINTILQRIASPATTNNTLRDVIGAVVGIAGDAVGVTGLGATIDSGGQGKPAGNYTGPAPGAPGSGNANQAPPSGGPFSNSPGSGPFGIPFPFLIGGFALLLLIIGLSASSSSK